MYSGLKNGQVLERIGVCFWLCLCRVYEKWASRVIFPNNSHKQMNRRSVFSIFCLSNIPEFKDIFLNIKDHLVLFCFIVFCFHDPWHNSSKSRQKTMNYQRFERKVGWSLFTLKQLGVLSLSRNCGNWRKV